MFCCSLLYVHSSIAIILMGKRELIALPQAAGQVKILIFQLKLKFFLMYANMFCDAGQMPILRHFKA